MVEAIGKNGPLSEEEIFRINEEVMRKRAERLKTASEQPKVETPQVYASPKIKEEKPVNQTSKIEKIAEVATNNIPEDIGNLVGNAIAGDIVLIGNYNGRKWHLFKDDNFVELWNGHEHYLVFVGTRTIAQVEDAKMDFSYNGNGVKTDLDFKLFLNYMKESGYQIKWKSR